MRAYESPQEKPKNHKETKECQEQSDCRNRNCTKKGLAFDLEIRTKRRERAIKNEGSKRQENDIDMPILEEKDGSVSIYHTESMCVAKEL